MQFVPVALCENRKEVEHFFARMGAHLAVTTVLGGTDLHAENVIANGEHPVVVDLETLFEGLPLPEGPSGATARGWAELRQSVMRTLLLPEPMILGDSKEDWPDMSALGQSTEQLTPMPVARWARAGTGCMRLVYQKVKLPRGHSLPQLAGEPVQSGANVDCIVQGFAQAYALLRKLKLELLASRGPLSAFEGKPVRQVFRDTRTYALTLHASYHPRFQRDATACEAMLRDALRVRADDWQPWLKIGRAHV